MAAISKTGAAGVVLITLPSGQFLMALRTSLFGLAIIALISLFFTGLIPTSQPTGKPVQPA